MDPNKLINARSVTHQQLERWIAENRTVVERIVAVSGDHSRLRAAKDFLKAFGGGTWAAGIIKWKEDPVIGYDYFNDYVEGME